MSIQFFKKYVDLIGYGSNLVLEGTSKNKFKKFEIEGKTEQEQYEGYNELETTQIYEQTTRNGIAFKTNKDGTITLNGTATANMDIYFMNNTEEINLETNQNYILSKKIVNGSASHLMIACYLDNVTSTFSGNIKDLGSDTEIRTLQNCRIFVNSGDVFNDVTVGLMLLKGTTDKPYEPYVRTEYQAQTQNTHNKLKM